MKLYKIRCVDRIHGTRIFEFVIESQGVTLMKVSNEDGRLEIDWGNELIREGVRIVESQISHVLEKRSVKGIRENEWMHDVTRIPEITEKEMEIVRRANMVNRL